MDKNELMLFCKSKELTQNFANRHQCSIGKVKYWLRKYNLEKTQSSYINKREIKRINALYNSGKSIREIHSITKLSVCSIEKYIDKLRTKSEALSTPEHRAKSKSGLNHYVFDEITKESAYALGLIVTDGSVDRSGYKINYHSKDDELIQIMRRIFNLSGSSYKGSTGESLSFNSTYMVKSIAKHGVFPNKTFTVKMPLLEDKYYSHFFRGVLDGDGYIGFSKGSLSIQIASASKDFVDDMIEYITKKLNIKTTISFKRNCYVIYFGGKKAAIPFCQYVYQNSQGLRLSRKYDRFINAYGR